MNAEAKTDRWLAASLRTPGAAGRPREVDTPTLLGRASFHGLDPWLWNHRSALPLANPEIDVLGERVMHQVACSQARTYRMVELVAALRARGIAVLVLKGAALAAAVYGRPWHRPSADLDLLIAPEDRASARAWLRASGWQAQPGVDGALVSGQQSWRRPGQTLPDAHAPPLDLHWRLSNAHWLSRGQPFRCLYAASHRLEKHPGVRWLGPVNAMLHATAHRALHLRAAPLHDETGRVRMGERFIWLLDILELARRMDHAQIRQLESRAHALGLSAIVRSGLRAAFELSPSPPFALDSITLRAGESSARILSGGRIAALRADLAALPDWNDRIAFLNQHLFPSTTYMRQRYGDAPRASLCWLYVQRLVGGSGRWLRHAGARRTSQQV